MAASNENWKTFRAELNQQLEQEQSFIENAEAGRLGLWHREPGKPQVDTTAAHVEIAKRSIEVLRGVIAKIDKDHLAD